VRIGYDAKYVPQLIDKATGWAVDVEGNAVLQVTIQAPNFASSGRRYTREPWITGQQLIGQLGAVREVVFAGYPPTSKVTVFGIGTSHMTPFRVVIVPDPANHVTSVAVDVAH
jgi:hypothetical protein